MLDVFAHLCPICNHESEGCEGWELEYEPYICANCKGGMFGWWHYCAHCKSEIDWDNIYGFSNN